MKPKHTRKCMLPFNWPKPPLQVALIEPEIPPNTGNIARLCAATGTRLHLVGRLGFRLNDAKLRRAGLDYWDAVDLERNADLAELFRCAAPSTCHFFSTRGVVNYTSVRYQAGDTLVFGCETRGLPEELLDQYPDHVLGIPMQGDRVRSLNLANAVAIVLYEALRQLQKPADGPPSLAP
ncbi:MAG: tRNA (cytidine(34)-2'-O)-methyltransferase [Kiritimatiellae bacterium]|nr:tRNA (cytidine(34)-2'-O)-methyltransferase [Kiritimatiellia bacterium]